jgi:hypothetical protein
MICPNFLDNPPLVIVGKILLRDLPRSVYSGIVLARSFRCSSRTLLSEYRRFPPVGPHGRCLVFSSEICAGSLSDKTTSDGMPRVALADP